MSNKECLFDEPWRGQCGKPTVPGEEGIHYCCEEHTKEKCQVCGGQAFTRCQASIGWMCGVPLCNTCGAGQMCLVHASAGPLAIIRGLLGGGPVPSVFATHVAYAEIQEKMDKQIDALKGFRFQRYQGQLKEK